MLVRRVVRRSFRPATNLFRGLRRKIYGPTTHVQTDSNLVSLTFDDGPNPKSTVELLKILESFGAKATFFIVGKNAIRYPEIVKLIADQGHAIGNHSYSHATFPHMTSKARRSDIHKCEAALQPYMAMLFRPPFGSENIFCHYDALHLGYRVIKWNISVDDWRQYSPEWIAERLVNQLKGGSIALLHDNVIDRPGSDQQQTLEATRMLLSVASRRYTFCTVPQLLAAGKPMTSFHDP
jgi:peptidoglycan-N-acetylglucosamine deacetylase